ncbi:hypothetical protein Glove_454g4 [Diversispora epigaea]|uniref:Uncharacterized protein n=1 Tax=Diversispora epigaea TaxID=1348612 RepID=A0A397GV60_9GLOM|nr:hypothetical protein Glove_454g4 [Diversispora epigaea]
MPQPLLETIKIDVIPEGVGILTLNRPDRDNALNSVLLKDLLVAFQWVTIEEKVKVVIITGNGEYFTSGWDLAEVSQLKNPEEIVERMRANVEVFEKLIESLIDFPKLLLAAVNGRAVGFGVTILPHCDAIYSVPEATFDTPFMKMAICAEACSSYLLPKFLGNSTANEMLLMGRLFTASELVNHRFINRIIQKENLLNETIKEAIPVTNFSFEAVKQTKQLIKSDDIRDHLKKILKKENEVLIERVFSGDLIQFVAKFIFDRQRLKKKSNNDSKL